MGIAASTIVPGTFGAMFEPFGGAMMEDATQPVELIANAVAHTRLAGSARIELLFGARTVPAWPEQPTGLARRAMSGFARWVVSNAAKARDAEGVIDFQARRYMIDFGAYAELYAGGQQWSGASGRSLSRMLIDKDVRATPFWLTDLLDGVSAATEADREDVRGVSCRRLTANVDPGRMAAVLPTGWLDDPDALEVEVWIDDDRYLRRVLTRAEARTQALELWEIGSSSTTSTGAGYPRFDPSTELVSTPHQPDAPLPSINRKTARDRSNVNL